MVEGTHRVFLFLFFVELCNKRLQMSVVTKQGDCGLSSLVYNGHLISKSHIIFDVLGDIDELNTSIAKANQTVHTVKQAHRQLETISTVLMKLNEDLYTIMAFLSKLNIDINNSVSCDSKHEESVRLLIMDIEHIIRSVEPYLDTSIHLQKNVIRGEVSCDIDLSRAIARRAERNIWALHEYLYGNSMVALIGKYLNRLSDLLYILAMNKIVTRCK